MTAALLCALVPGAASAQEHPLTLDEIVGLARTNDARVHEAEADLRNFEGKYREAFWTAHFPHMEATFAVAGPTPEARNDGMGGPPLAADGSPCSPTQPCPTLEYDLNFGKAGVMLRTEATALQPLYTFGKLEALQRAAEMGILAGENLHRRAQDEAGFQAAEAFFGFQLAREGKDSLAESLKQIDDAQKKIQALLDQESPQVSKLDTYKIAFFRKEVEARQEQAENGIQLATAAIKLVAGIPADHPVAVAAQDLEAPTIQLGPVERYLMLAQDNRPELRAINAGLVAREQEVFIRDRMFLPDFGVGGFFRWMWTTSSTRQRSPFAADPYNDLSGGIFLVAKETFDFPVIAAKADQARAEHDKMAAQRKLLEAAVSLEVRKIYGDLRQALDNSTKQVDAERSAKRWATAAFANFEIGTTDTRELIEAMGALAYASTEKLKAWHDAQVGIRDLTRATGLTDPAGLSAP